MTVIAAVSVKLSRPTCMLNVLVILCPCCDAAALTSRLMQRRLLYLVNGERIDILVKECGSSVLQSAVTMYDLYYITVFHISIHLKVINDKDGAENVATVSLETAKVTIINLYRSTWM